MSDHYPQAVALLHELAADGDADELDGTDRVQLFTLGGCALYATALAATHQWQVMSYGYDECTEDRDDGFVPCSDYTGGLCGCKAHHFYALSPDGTLHDINGAHDITAVADRAYDEHCTLWAVDDTQLACVLESWHYGCGDDSDIAALALAVA
jgi:hypothetical protein